MEESELIDDAPPTEEPLQTDMPEEVEPPPPPESEKVALSFWRRALRVLLVILIMLGLGSLLVIFMLFVPTRRDLAEANRQLTEVSQQSATDLETANLEIDRLSALEATNQSLEGELHLANLQITILQLKYDVATAQLALAEGDVDRAHLALSNTEETLNALEDLLPENQRGVVTDLLTRLDLVFDGLENNLYAAESDLDVMMTSLLKLESAVIR